ncbi:MAG: hypothetical protein R2724_32505 [Bryobacterales bacterium]
MSASSADIYLLDVDANMKPSGEPRRVTFDGANIASLAWDPDGDHLYFSSDRSNQSSAQTIWRIEVGHEGAEPISWGRAGPAH